MLGPGELGPAELASVELAPKELAPGMLARETMRPGARPEQPLLAAARRALDLAAVAALGVRVTAAIRALDLAAVAAQGLGLLGDGA